MPSPMEPMLSHKVSMGHMQLLLRPRSATLSSLSLFFACLPINFSLLVDKVRLVKYVVCAGKTMSRMQFRAVLFGFEILAGEQIQFSAVRSEREKDQSSDQQD
jgi:hypothetical protein